MTGANADQAEFWNSEPGQVWVAEQDRFDTLLHEALEAVLDHAAPRPGEAVLDVGCGAGTSSLRLSDMVGAAGRVTALDISAPLLDHARARAGAEPTARSNLRFTLGDAQTHELGGLEVDLVISRFGVMFFDDPRAAFANLRRAVRPGGRLAMICWQGAPENPWFMVPMQAAIARLGKPEPMDPLAPGPMAFKDIDRVTAILTGAGWDNASGRPIEVDLIPPQSLEAAADFATSAGPATRVMREKGGTPEDAEAIRATCAEGFAPYQVAQGLRIPARLIVYSAINPD